MSLADDLGLPVVATNDTHFLRREDHDASFFEITQCLRPDVGLYDLLDVERRLHARHEARAVHRVLQRQRVDDRGEHAHVVGLGPVHADGARLHAAEDVPPANDDADLDAKLDHVTATWQVAPEVTTEATTTV